MPPPNFLMMLVCAAPPTRDTDSPALIAGTELMKQNQYSPLSVAEMATSLFAANSGSLDDLETNKVVDFISIAEVIF
jgi:hypothetical protein